MAMVRIYVLVERALGFAYFIGRPMYIHHVVRAHSHQLRSASSGSSQVPWVQEDVVPDSGTLVSELGIAALGTQRKVF